MVVWSHIIINSHPGYMIFPIRAFIHNIYKYQARNAVEINYPFIQGFASAKRHEIKTIPFNILLNNYSWIFATSPSHRGF